MDIFVPVGALRIRQGGTIDSSGQEDELHKLKDGESPKVYFTGYTGEEEEGTRTDYSEVQPQLDAELMPENHIAVPDDLPITNRLVQRTGKLLRAAEMDK